MGLDMLTMTDDMTRRTRGRSVVLSISGGKDSAAMALWLRDLGIECQLVFMDTGWEHQVTYEYLRGPLTAKLGAIKEIRAIVEFSSEQSRLVEKVIADLPLVSRAFKAGSPMVRMALKKGMFPAGKKRWCTEYLKEEPIKRFLEPLIDAGADVVNAVGIRAAESEQRATYTEWVELKWARKAGRKLLHYDCEMWRPILRWTISDVIAIHERHGLRPNPLYLLPGIERVGCGPCIRSRKAEIRATADHMPESIAILRELEVAVGRLAAYRLGNSKIKNPILRAPAFFQAPMGDNGACWPIDEVVAWSRTSRGGRQFELFAPTESEGCMRWGLCEGAPAPQDEIQ